VDMKVKTQMGHTMLNILVGDNGIGIASKEQTKIFNRFYNNKTGEAGISNGIGLSLTKDLTQLHHGTISMESQWGKGTVFTVEIPIDKMSYTPLELLNKTLDEEAGMQIDMNTKVEPSTGIDMEIWNNRSNLLLVEDDDELLCLMKEILSKKYNVFTAGSGREALQCIRVNEIDIVVSDVMMPEPNGWELCRRIKNDMGTSHVIVLLLTIKTQPEDQVESYEAGADAYVAKPFDVKVLDAQIENLLHGKLVKQRIFKDDTKIKISDLETTSLDEQFLKKAIEAVEANLTEPNFDVSALAGLVNMSRSTLLRKIKTVTGLTPLEFIRNIRMKHACRMLKDTNMSISETALSVGYYNRKYFTTCFKEEFGITPSEYQKKL
jgi:DNA-binding response OmpR family regulator